MVKASKDYSDVIASVLSTIFDKLLLVIVCIICMILVFAFLAFVGDQIKENKKRSMFPNTINKGFTKALGWVFAQLSGGVAQKPHTTFNHGLVVVLVIIKVTLIVSIASFVAVLVTSAETKYDIESIDDLTSQDKIVTVIGTAPYDYAVDRVKEAEIVTASSISEMFDMYADPDNGITAAFYDGPIITYAKHTDGRFSDSIVLDTLYDRFKLGMALENSHSTLEEKINGIMIGNENSGELDELWETWFRDVLGAQEDERKDDSFTFIAMIIILVGLSISIILYLCLKFRETKKLMDWLHNIVKNYHDNINIDNVDDQTDIVPINHEDTVINLTKGTILFVRTDCEEGVFNWNVYGSSLINTKWYRTIHEEYDSNNRDEIRYIDDERAAWACIKKTGETSADVALLRQEMGEFREDFKAFMNLVQTPESGFPKQRSVKPVMEVTQQTSDGTTINNSSTQHSAPGVPGGRVVTYSDVKYHQV